MHPRAAAVAVVLALALAGGVALATRGGHHTATPPPAGGQDANATPPVRPPAAESGLLPWQLAAPLSREVVLPRAGTRHELVVLGGLTSGDVSTNGVDVLDTRTGRIVPHGSLLQATHDAAGAALGARQLVIGGGTATAAGGTQIVAGGKTTRSGAPGTRADAGAVTIGNTVYVVGGYDGSAMDAEVTSTTDGHSYRAVAALPVALRYPALAVLGSQIYVFGGLRANGHPSNAVQLVDPANRTAHVVGHLPKALDGAAAGVLGGTIYLAGGRTAAGPTSAVYAFQPGNASFLRAGSLRIPTAYAGAAVSDGRLWIVGGESSGGQPTSTVQMVVPNPGFGKAGDRGAGSPFSGSKLLIADRGNDRLLLLNDRDQVVWRYPGPGRAAPHGGFYFPDDAFFFDKGHGIISNQEDNNTIVEIGYPSGRVLWDVGHPRVPGSGPGYYHQPDDAYVLANGLVTVADAGNNVVKLIARSGAVVARIGNGVDAHVPGVSIAYPNGDTPLPDGNLLISEVNGAWVSEYTPTGHLVWTTHVPGVAYPSDPQQLGPDRYLMTDYNPAAEGRILEFARSGQVVWRYDVATGDGMLRKPSLAERLPDGLVMVNDDYRDRLVVIDPTTNMIVWQYGITDVPGTAPGLLSIPDGFDLLEPGGVTPTHRATG